MNPDNLDWLRKPDANYGAFATYGDTNPGHVWLSLPYWEGRTDLYSTRRMALAGDPEAIAHMHAYRLALITARLKKGLPP